MFIPCGDVEHYPGTSHDNDRSDAAEGLYSRWTAALPYKSDLAEGHTQHTLMLEPSNAMAITIIMKMVMIMIIICATVMMMIWLVRSIFRHDMTKVKGGR